jgi:anti-sigma B factor antagonist
MDASGTPHPRSGGRALRPFTRRRSGAQIVARQEVALPYEIRRFERGARAHLVVASGELDLHAAASMRETLSFLVALGRTHLVIDMSEATFIDSAMIGVLAGHIRQTAGGVGSLAVVCSNENILRTLEIAGIDRELQILSALSDAVVEKVATMPRIHEHSKFLPAPRTQTLMVAPDASQLALARGFAVAAARRAGLDSRQQYNLAVASNEAVANAIQHGRPCASGSIEMWVDEGRTALKVGVRNGGEFVLEPLPPDPLHEGGRGLRLMSRMVDEITVRRENAEVVVELSINR